jgi:hypothetical protein
MAASPNRLHAKNEPLNNLMYGTRLWFASAWSPDVAASANESTIYTTTLRLSPQNVLKDKLLHQLTGRREKKMGDTFRQGELTINVQIRRSEDAPASPLPHLNVEAGMQNVAKRICCGRQTGERRSNKNMGAPACAGRALPNFQESK